MGFTNALLCNGGKNCQFLIMKLGGTLKCPIRVNNKHISYSLLHNPLFETIEVIFLCILQNNVPMTCPIMVLQ